MGRWVKSQRMYMDTVVNGSIESIISRWKDLTILRDWTVYNIKDGKKMSKSQGNVITNQELFDSYPVEAIRYYLISNTKRRGRN